MPDHQQNNPRGANLAKQVFGIDLGTTYSCIAYVDSFSQPVIVSNMDGNPTTPSVVLFNEDGTYAVGESAKREFGARSDRVVSLVKRHMGKPKPSQVDADAPSWSFTTPEGREFSAPEVSSKILQALVEDARNVTGEAVEDVVITVPAYFGAAERDATHAAGKIAGLNVVDIINEPTAAAFTYGFAKADSAAQEAVLVYDLGGGTFDVTVIVVSSGDIVVKATDGDHELGGDNWDQRLLDIIVRKFMDENPDADDPMFDPMSLGDIRLEAEGVKRRLSNTQSAKARVASGATLAQIEITREEFEAATAELVEQTIQLTKNCIEAARGAGVTKLDRVLLVGGSSFMPMVAPRVQETTGIQPQLHEPNLAVAKGAALWGQKANITAQIVEKLREQGHDVTPETMDTVDPDAFDRAAEDVASTIGVRTDVVKEFAEKRVVNVCSQGFGIQVLNNDVLEVVFLIHRNDPLPASIQTSDFSTIVDNQPRLEIVVYEQGTADEQPNPDVNKVIVNGTTDSIPSGHPRGTPLDVSFEMDNSGVVTVTVRHPAVPEPLILKQKTGQGLTDEEIADSLAQMAAITRAG
jgi:molecular chaperone DnaK (HSP70)